MVQIQATHRKGVSLNDIYIHVYVHVHMYIPFLPIHGRKVRTVPNRQNTQFASVTLKTCFPPLLHKFSHTEGSVVEGAKEYCGGRRR